MSSLPPPPPGWSGPPAGPSPTSWSPQGYGTPLAPAARVPWRSLKGLALALSILLGLASLLSLGLVWALRDRLSLVEDGAGFIEVDDADDRVAAISSLVVLVGIAVFVLLVIWTWRGAKNLQVLGRPNPTLGPGWAIGLWFIPFANFVLGFLVLADAWRGGEASVPWGDRAWKRVRVGTPLIVWWVLLVGSAVAAVAMNAVSDEELDTLQEVRDNANYGTVAFVLSALASLAAIVAIQAISRRQHEAHDAQVAAGGPAQPWGQSAPWSPAAPWGQAAPPGQPAPWGAPPPPPPPGWG